MRDRQTGKEREGVRDRQTGKETERDGDNNKEDF